MDDVEQQIEAWADVTAPPSEESIAAADVIEGRVPVAAGPPIAPVVPRRRERWLAVVAAVFVLAVVGVGLVLQDDQPEHLRAEQTPVTTTRSEAVPEVRYDLLGVVYHEVDQAVALAAAQSQKELERRWSDAGATSPMPVVDFDRSLVVSITIADDTCPPELSGFRREGSAIEPRFVEGATEEGCDGTFMATYFVALEWDTTGDEFLLVQTGFRPEDDQETLEVVRRGTAPVPDATTTVPDRSVGEPVEFRLLAASDLGEEEPGALHAAQLPGEVAELWLDAAQAPPIPEVDLDREVVVSLTTWGSPCDVLTGLVRTETGFTPRFVQEPGEEPCDEFLSTTTNVIAIPWAVIGDGATLEIPAHESQYPDLPETAYSDRQLQLTRMTDPDVTTSLRLDATEVAAGGEIAGTVTVVNDSGEAVGATTCGDLFRASLTHSTGYRQPIHRNFCATGFTIPEGTSTYPVTVEGNFTTCLPPYSRPGASPPCEDDGTPPPLQAGTYLLTIQPPPGVPPPDPVTITIT